MTAPDRQLDRVAALLDLNRAEEAMTELSRLAGPEATQRRAFQLRAAALTDLQRWSAVADTARQGLGETGPDAELLGRLGLALRHQGDHAGAERALLDGLAREPQQVWLLCQYADLCTMVGQTGKAAQLVDRAAALAPEHPLVWVSRFQLAYAAGDDRTAQRIARDYLGRWPDHPAALFLHGAIAGERGQVGLAQQSFGQAVAQDPTDADYADAAWQSRVYAHPLLLPLRPLYRLGVLRTWLIAVGTIVALNVAGLEPVAALVGLLWLGYCVWSWVAPTLVRRLVLGRWRS
ncbi:tetratricopeptide repeat protein [Micromonospora mirobrigensis]|uniref:Tetratricopeptide repeat-containing protein n=1 Tax=Micromonospora mirobrigensis TaxID=262898 RepID=A0A1C4UIM9_9ACTN|nr:tetratricopeptide repeat protein [Micromonospora mirobrigensis]SCE71517.1 Tetratricopeptide repeat-containing protein [Micromonospora mirobrigensis]